MGIDHSGLDRLVKTFLPEFAFWNTATPTLGHDLHIADGVKSLAPRAITGVMGTHVTAAPESALENRHIDLVIRREPEKTIQEICSSPPREWRDLKGISFRHPENGKICHNPDQEWIKPEHIPAPAWHYLDLSPYRLPLKGRPFLTVSPIRGCPYRCSFCTAPLYYGRKLRKRPVQSVMDEISHNIQEFGIRDYFVWADTFTADPAYVREFSQEILKRRLRIRWTCNSRVDTVDPQMLAGMKKAGLWMISFGLESGNDVILEGSGKGINVAQARRAVIMAHNLGIRTSGHFILGLPGETERTMRETLNLALALPLDIAQFYAAAPFPGTRLFEESTDKGWLGKAVEVSQNTAVMTLPGISAKRVNEFRRHAQRRFYSRPETISNILGMIEKKALAHILKNLSVFLGNRA